MNLLKRICLFIFALGGILCVVALALPWYGTWTGWASSLFELEWFYVAVEALAAITLLGLAAMLLRALFAPRNAKAVLVTRGSGDQISVTTAAISSQAAHIVEEDGGFFAEKVWVRARRRGRVEVAMRVRPAHAVNVADEGKYLHDKLASGLSELCGGSIRRIDLEFVESDSLDPKPDFSSLVATERPESSPAQDALGTQEPVSEITVPMGQVSGLGDPSEREA